MPARHTSSLSQPQRQLVELLQHLNFGYVDHLPVRGGQPVLDPLPRRVREHKFCSENGAREESTLQEFSLKPQVRELLDAMTEIGDGVIERIEVKHGLPFRMIVPENGAL